MRIRQCTFTVTFDHREELIFARSGCPSRESSLPSRLWVWRDTDRLHALSGESCHPEAGEARRGISGRVLDHTFSERDRSVPYVRSLAVFAGSGCQLRSKRASTRLPPRPRNERGSRITSPAPLIQLCSYRPLRQSHQRKFRRGILFCRKQLFDFARHDHPGSERHLEAAFTAMLILHAYFNCMAVQNPSDQIQGRMSGADDCLGFSVVGRQRLSATRNSGASVSMYS